MKTLVSLLLILMVFGMIKAQTIGHLHYQLEFSSNNPAMPIIEGSYMDFYFTPQSTRMDLNMGALMKLNTIVDLKKEKGIMLMEIMGIKNAKELNWANDVSGASLPKITVTNETKTIIGFLCTKIIAKDEKGAESILWITKDLKAYLKGQNQFGSTPFEGVPLEFNSEANGMKTHFIATEFKDYVDSQMFSLEIPGDYPLMTEEDFKNLGLNP